MSNFTPGPWKFNPTVRRKRHELDKLLNKNPKGSWVEIGTNEICQKNTGEVICSPRGTKNIKLIESAPDLLGALIICCAELREYDIANDPGSLTEKHRKEAIRLAEKVIKKALGK